MLKNDAVIQLPKLFLAKLNVVFFFFCFTGKFSASFKNQ